MGCDLDYAMVMRIGDEGIAFFRFLWAIVTVSLRDSTCLAVTLSAPARCRADSAYLRALRAILFLHHQHFTISIETCLMP